MRDFRQLQVWEKAHQLTLSIYRITFSFPKVERTGLIDQMRRSSSSIPTNIAEGCGLGTERQLAHYMQISMGSASELEYQLLLARDLGYLIEDNYRPLNDAVVEVKRMLAPFIKRLQSAR
jgi:four helix bundle protein